VYCLDSRGIVVQFAAGARELFSSQKLPENLWGPISLLINDTGVKADGA